MALKPGDIQELAWTAGMSAVQTGSDFWTGSALHSHTGQ
jgi:hypothetical protein